MGTAMPTELPSFDNFWRSCTTPTYSCFQAARLFNKPFCKSSGDYHVCAEGRWISREKEFPSFAGALLMITPSTSEFVRTSLLSSSSHVFQIFSLAGTFSHLTSRPVARDPHSFGQTIPSLDQTTTHDERRGEANNRRCEPCTILLSKI
jgi:hypothetical protein